MTAVPSPRYEAIAEAIVFGHEPEVTAPEMSTEVLQLERTAVLTMAALAPTIAPPSHLQQRLAAAGLAFCVERIQQLREHPLRAVPIQAPAASVSRRAWGMFVLGAAALAMVWLALEFRRTPAAVLQSNVLQRAALLADPNVQHIEWKAGPSPLAGAIGGEVVWSQDRQEGLLVFHGLPPLDSEHRFQLWIVDGLRQGAPVDGGLFRIDAATGETVIPVHPKLPIGKAAAFVVTVEGKQGAVVSKQEHVVAIAGL